MVNAVLILTILLVAGMTIYFSSFKDRTVIEDTNSSTITYQYLKDNLYYVWGKKKSKSDKEYRNQAEEDRATSEATAYEERVTQARCGNPEARQILLEDIYQICAEAVENSASIDSFEAIMFSDPNLMTVNQKFVTLMYYARKALEEENSHILLTNKGQNNVNQTFKRVLQLTRALDTPKKHPLYPKEDLYIVTKEDINRTYDNIIAKRPVTMEDALYINAQFLYMDFIGAPVIDPLIYDTSYTSLEGGYVGTLTGEHRNEHGIQNSIIAKLPGKKVYLPFLEFNSITQFNNACMALSANYKGAFTVGDGYLTTSLANKYRVNIITNRIAESFTFNIRVPDQDTSTNLELLKRQPDNVKVYGAEMVAEWLEFEGEGLTTLVIIGGQGSGKSTHLNAHINNLPLATAIRGMSNIDESNFNYKYPYRDIKLVLYDKDNPELSASKIAAILKRTDGEFFIMTEMLSSEDVNLFVDASLSGWLGLSGTSHGADALATIRYLASKYESHPTDETYKLIADLCKTVAKFEYRDNLYFMDNITEVVPRDYNIPWSTVRDEESLDDEAINLMTARNQELYFRNSMNPKLFEANVLFAFDTSTKTYYPKNPPSVGLCYSIARRLKPNRKRDFANFLSTHFNGFDVWKELIDAKLINLRDDMSIEDWIGGR